VSTDALTVYTVGHSNRSLDDFLTLLQAHQVERLVDVRKLPGSRRYPHFNSDALQASLAKVGIDYLHMPGLGGRRKAQPDSPNGGWRNASFQAYADYMLTPEFEEELQALVALARKSRTVIMCSEALPWQCHRSLIADALVVRDIVVENLMTPTKRDCHALRDFAKVEDGRLWYPPVKEEEAQRRLF
jgi:uncharacterized protein (DUF488 family)